VAALFFANEAQVQIGLSELGSVIYDGREAVSRLIQVSGTHGFRCLLKPFRDRGADLRGLTDGDLDRDEQKENQ
jgi:hypothetical protein